ncbi:hypothetical protein [Pseudomonas sp. CFBP 13602]|uniref:hypothetical protein n=1 Tax=Pseudomonas sp. CFBP 13602 TaxID=2774039 RepID=UPI0017825BEB|nr:hypothetical protein [Pseudomonas sp. CFBP 13602]MBD8825286.1 hypothetical protein [Pseudomonas sp. CFBP 13602]
MAPSSSTQIPDPLDRPNDPIEPEPFAEGKPAEDPRPGDENLSPVPMDRDREMDPREVRTQTGETDMSPDDSA